MIKIKASHFKIVLYFKRCYVQIYNEIVLSIMNKQLIENNDLKWVNWIRLSIKQYFYHTKL